jgi:two-component system chemotaxis response regulator CheB
MSVKVLVVDDSGFFRRRINEILNSVPEIEVIGSANNGKEGLDKAKALKPDVITMDYEMPVMDGVTAVRHIMAECPTPILMFSTLTYEGARVTLDALEAGAVDFLPKNFEDISRNASRMQEVLKERILQVAKTRKGVDLTPKKPASPTNSSARASAPVGRASAPPNVGRTAGLGAKAPGAGPSAQTTATARRSTARPGRKTIKHPVDLLVIGTSTGGPVALQKIISQLPSNLPVPVLLVQHMPATFTPAFAERLNSMSSLRVKQAEDGAVVRPGEVLLAPGGKQMLVNRNGRSISVNIIEGDERLTYKPSVDLTFGSASRAFPGKVLALVLTGMGADGREGSRMLKGTGATVWTQSEKTCVVYGMPMAVDKAGYSDLSLDINDFADRIVSELM